MKIVLIGNVDNGKSTLGGQLLFKSNTINDRLIDFIKKQASELKRARCWLAHILDVDDNEKAYGKTYSLNIVPFEYKGKTYEIIDVPGHRELVNEMIYGTSLANIGILLISIRKGEYEAGLSQTIEHCLIVRGMGISSLIVCVNKMDTIDWNSDEYNRVVSDFTNKIKKYRFKHVVFVPISAYHGTNIMTRFDNPLVECSLIEAIDNINIVPRETKLIQPNDFKVNGRFIFSHIENLITTGFVCKLHTNDELYNAEIIDIQNDKHSYVTKQNSQGKIINILLKLDTNKSINENIILRDQNRTIAIGKVY